MSKLICNADIEHLHKEEKSVCLIDSCTIITPAARDLAQSYNIEFKKKECCEVSPKGQSAMECLTELISGEKNLSPDLIELFKSILKGDVQETAPFEACSHPNGLKVVNGKSVRMDEFDTGNKAAKVQFQEVVGKDESKMSAGFLIIDNSWFNWNLTYEEIDYVIEGTLCVTIDGKKFTAKAGDVLYVPANSSVVWSSPDKAKIFYSTYPSNWPDLM